MLFILPGYASAKDNGEWVHSEKPFDFKNGLLDDDYFLSKISNNLDPEMFNNKTNEKIKPTRSSYVITSNIFFNLEGMYINGEAESNNHWVVIVNFVDGTNKVIYREMVRGKYDDYIDLDLKNIRQIIIQPPNEHTKYLNEIEFFGSYQKQLYDPVKILNVDSKENEIIIKFEKPKDAQAVDIWLDDQKIVRTTESEYTLENLEPNKEYELTFYSYYGNDKYGEAVTHKATTKKEELGEVLTLNAKAESHKQVNLNWENPKKSNFSHVTIYRDEIGEKKGLLDKFSLFMVAHANDSTKLFETNGTYFIDHSVAASMQYEYLVTTTDDEGKESKGVSQKVTTPKKPNPDPPTSEMEKQENGDYLVTWTSPKEGKVKIKVGGKDYVTLDAATGSFLIPGDDMVYNFLGQPQVQVIAIDSDGDESGGSKPGKPGSTGDGNGGSSEGGGIDGLSGIEAKDVLSGTMSFLKILAPLIILALAVFLTPRIIRVIKSAINKNQRSYR